MVVGSRSCYVFLLLALLIFCCLPISSLIWNYYHLSWEIAEPSAYYMTVSEVQQDDEILWTIWVRNGQVQHFEVSGTAEKSLLGQNGFTIEEIFAVQRSQCHLFSTNCSLEYNPAYHYPESLAVYDWLVIRVTRFVPCERLENCP